MTSGVEGLDHEDLCVNRAFYRAVFEVNTAIKIIIDPATALLVDANPAAARFYGYPLEKLRGMSLHAINVAPEPGVREALGSAASGEQSLFEMRHRLASGEIRDIEIHSGPLELPGRRLVLSIIHDITVRKRLEEQLHQAQKMEAVGLLAGGVAHDFNNLLTALFGYGEILAEDSEKGSRAHLAAQSLLRVLGRAEELTRQLLTFSGKRMLKPRRMDLNELVLSAQDVLTRLVGNAIRIELDLAETLSAVLADPGQLELVLINLVVNARDAMPQGGVLTIRTAAEPRNEVSLALCDTGAGMDEETMRRLFEPFFTTKPPHQGTGLGLSTVYGVVQQCGGRIEVSSQPGLGSRFTLRFPAVTGAAEHEGKKAPAHASPALPRAAATVLVVDDEPEVRELLCASLSAHGYRALSAPDGPSALALAAREPVCGIDLMVTDVRMPGMDGPTLARRLLEARPEVRLVFVSGYSDGLVSPEDLARWRALFLAKPFTGKQLARAVAETIGDRESVRSCSSR